MRALPTRYGLVSELDAYLVLDRHAVAIVAKPLLADLTRAQLHLALEGLWSFAALARRLADGFGGRPIRAETARA